MAAPSWTCTPPELVGVWERRWIMRPGLKAAAPGEQDSAVTVRYVSAASAFVDVRVAQRRGRWPDQAEDEAEVAAAAADRRADAFAGVTTLQDGVVRWHAILSLEGGGPRAEAWRAAEAGAPRPTEDAGSKEDVGEGVWHEHAWPDAGAYTEEWALVCHGPSLAARRGDDELLVVVGDWFGYARDRRRGGAAAAAPRPADVSFVVGRVSTGWLVELSACGPEEGRRLVVGGEGDWRALPGSTLPAAALAELLRGPDRRCEDPRPRPWVADPPSGLQTARLLLMPLTAAHVDADYEAVLDGLTPHGSPLQHVFARQDTWPAYGMSRREDLLDLRRHEAEFGLGLAFAYTVLDRSDEGVVLGCCYVNPPTRAGYDAEAFLWIRPGARAHAELDRELEAALRGWLARGGVVADAAAGASGDAEDLPRCWPFVEVAFPGRDLPEGPSADRERCWDFWESVPLSGTRHARVAADAETVVLHAAGASGLIP